MWPCTVRTHTIWLFPAVNECIESAGTSTRALPSRTTDSAVVREGKARVEVPADSMHSFTAGNNQIVWVLTVHGHIARWSDVKDEYLMSVAPRPRTRRSAEVAPAPGDQPQATTWNT